MASSPPQPQPQQQQEQAEDVQALRSLLLSPSTPDGIPSACRAVDSFLHHRRSSSEHSRDFYRFCFPLLLHRLFGFEDCHSIPRSAFSALSASSGGWLAEASSAAAAAAPGGDAVSKALVGLLSPAGALFASLLANENGVRFVFPTERLPDWVRRLLALDNGASILSHVAPLFKNRIKEDALGSVQVQLEVFEYYIFWFAYYAVCKDNSSLSGASYMPKKARSASKQRQIRSLGHWVSSFSHSSSHQDMPALVHNAYLQLLHLYLLHFVPLTCSSSQTISTASRQQHSTRTYQADFVMNALAVFWLMDDDSLTFPPSVHQSFQLSSLGITGLTYAPSASLLDALRLLINYLNSFMKCEIIEQPSASVSSCKLFLTFRRKPILSFDKGGPMPVSSFSAFSEFDFRRYSRSLQRPLYRFILRAFHSWPVGSPVKLASHVVDVWMDYLQPWNSLVDGMSGISPEKKNLETSFNKYGTQQTSYTEKWQGYVIGNYLFYTCLVTHFLEFALKFVQIDIEAVLQMTCKVLNTLTESTDLLDFLRRVNGAHHNFLLGRLSNSSSSVSSELLLAIQEQMLDWEDNRMRLNDQKSDMLHGLSLSQTKTTYPHFSCSYEAGGQTLRMLILQAEAELNSANENQSALAKTMEAIKEVGQKIFESHPLQNSGERLYIDAQHQVIGNTVIRALPRNTWSDVKYKGDWMKRPIESTEVAWLVRLLVRISDLINETLGLAPVCIIKLENEAQPIQVRNATTAHTTEMIESGFRDIFSRVKHLLLDFQLSKFVMIAGRLFWRVWLNILDELCRRGWRVNLRFLAKKPLAFCILSFLLWKFIYIFVRMFN